MPIHFVRDWLFHSEPCLTCQGVMTNMKLYDNISKSRMLSW